MAPSTLIPQHPPTTIKHHHRVQGLYLNTSRELKRLDALAFSPIFQVGLGVDGVNRFA
jgi:hypothetical protein